MTESVEAKLKRKVKKNLKTGKFTNQVTIMFSEDVEPQEVLDLFKNVRTRVSQQFPDTCIAWWLRRLRTVHKSTYPCIQLFTQKPINLEWLEKFLTSQTMVHRIRQRDWNTELEERFLNNREMFKHHIFKTFFQTDRVDRFKVTNRKCL